MDNNLQPIVQSFLQHLTQRDLEKLVQLFSETIDWYIPGDEQKAPWLGKRNSRQEVADFYHLLWQNTEPVSATVDGIFYNEERAVIMGEFSTKMLQTGRIVDSPFCIQMDIENEHIVKYRLLEDSYAVSMSLTP